MVDDNKKVVNDDYQKKALQDDIAMERFIDELVTAREDLWIKPENRERFKKALKEQLIDEINNHFINLLTKSDQQLLEKLVEKGITNQELNHFFEERVDNQIAHLTTIFQRFREMVMVGKK
jgi:predicted transcriptional regulator YheO